MIKIHNKKGVAIVTVLSVVALLMVMGAIGSYVIRNEALMTKNIKDVNIALKAAEAGIEKAAARIKNGIFDDFTGTLTNGANYNVKITETNCPSPAIKYACYIIDSTGTYNNVSREIKTSFSLDYNNSFGSFAADKQVVIDTIDLATIPIPPLDIYAKEGFDIGILIVGASTGDTSDINDLTYGDSYSFSNVTFYYEDTFIPSVKDMNYSINTTAIAPLCTDGAFGSDVTVTSVSNGAVICGDDVTIDNDISVDNLTVYARNNIIVNDAIYRKGGGGGGSATSFNVTLIAQGNITFGSNAEISTHGGHATYNITIYAGGKIDIETTGSGGGGGGGGGGGMNNSFIDVHGGGWSSQRGGILIVAGEGITQSSTSTANFLTMRGHKTGDLLIWTDGDVDINGIYMWGWTSDDAGPRNIAVIAYNGTITIDTLDTSRGGGMGGGGGGTLGGLTLDNLTDWAARASGPTKVILEDLLQQIANAINNGELKPDTVEISSWKTY